MSARVKQGLAAAGFLIAMLPVFFWDLVFQGRGFFYGDYRMQYYPWALELSRALKRLTLPFWTDKIGCGFPLLAEGQTGALHPLKMALYGLLPIEWAYPLGFLILFLAAGWFTYALLRRLGGSWGAGVTAALCYSYGSAYAGLVWGNATLWVMCWLPWAVDRAEALSRKPTARRTALLALALAFMWLGGVPQIALYGTLFVTAYAILRRGAVRWTIAACGLGIAAAAAQLLPTIELVWQSARSQTGLDFALQKSLNPANLAALVQPGFGFFGADMYLGLLPLALALLALKNPRQDRAARTFGLLALTALFIAFGKWNPLYVGAIKTLGMYSLRAPSKWILFTLFSLSVLAGLGWDKWWSSGTTRRARLLSVGAVLVASAGVWLAAFLIAREQGAALLAWGENYVRTQVYGKGGHPHSLDAYLARLPGLLQVLLNRTSFSDYYFRCTAGVGAGMVVWFFLHWRIESRKVLKLIGMGLIVMDLFLFSWVGSGFRGNRVDAAEIAPDAVTHRLTADPGYFRVYEFVPDAFDAPRWIPNANLIPGYASIGLYTPLAPAAYADKVGRLGSVDDSTGAFAESEWVPAESWSLLSRMNVKYLLSRRPLAEPGPWKEIVRSADGTVLYQNNGVWPRAYGSDWTGRKVLAGSATITESAAGKYRIRTRFEEPGRLVVSENGMFASGAFRSGWIARVDGKPAAIEPFEGCFLSVTLGAGEHRVELDYIPAFFWIGLGGSLAALLVIGVLIRR